MPHPFPFYSVDAPASHDLVEVSTTEAGPCPFPASEKRTPLRTMLLRIAPGALAVHMTYWSAGAEERDHGPYWKARWVVGPFISLLRGTRFTTHDIDRAVAYAERIRVELTDQSSGNLRCGVCKSILPQPAPACAFADHIEVSCTTSGHEVRAAFEAERVMRVWSVEEGAVTEGNSFSIASEGEAQDER